MVAICKRLIDHSWPDLTDEQIAQVQKLRFSKSDVRRVRVLGEKAQDGTLTKAETLELDNYRSVGHLLTTVKSLMRGMARDKAGAVVAAPVRRQRRAS